LEPTQAPRFLFGEKVAWPEADYWFSFGVEVKNAWNYTSTPHCAVLYGVQVQEQLCHYRAVTNIISILASERN
jgi:hypothetical protein